jgi:hypothetical protein
LSGFDKDEDLQDIPVDYPDLSVYDFNKYKPGEFFENAQR